ncbi:uncharacterized protein LOC126812416 [Patella vulgata]|uniref:uncharacterized protein LOC126812416 n=1 Tax=Patella vulgata TaxID=6465 RepID=UPI0024A95634|nr:uncharacterized protein LOC126812416 [Patella vulgata]
MSYKLLLVYVSVCITDTMGISPCANLSSPGDCCLCSAAGCNINCPNELFKINRSSTFCKPALYTSTTDTIIEFNSTSSTTESGDTEDNFVVCVVECPSGSYADTTGWCVQCGQLCATCAGEKDKCTSCNGGLDLSNSTCDVTTTDMMTDNTTATDSGDLHVGAIVGGSVGGAAFLVLVVVGIVCFCLKFPKKNKDQITMNQTGDLEMLPVQQKTEEGEILTEQKNTKDKRDYENVPKFDEHLATDVQRQHDKKYRYTKDPCQSATERLAKQRAQQPDDPLSAVLPHERTSFSAPQSVIYNEISENQSTTGEQDSIYINIPETQTGHYQNISLDENEYVNDGFIADFKSKRTNNDEQQIYQNQDVS